MTTVAGNRTTPLSPPYAIRAAWVFTGEGPPIADGVIDVAADGRIVDVRSGRDRDAVEFRDCAIVPPLVNPHVHLEFSDLAEPIAPMRPFPRWIGNVVSHRRGRTQPVGDIIACGIDELARTGTTAAGEIATIDNVGDYANCQVEVTAFHELIGIRRDEWPDILARAERFLDDTQGAEGVRPGLSPHSPYTVPQELFERTIALACDRAVPVAVHLAETHAERELLATRRGELVEMLQSLDLWQPDLHPLGRRPLDWLQRLAEVPRGLVIHGNHLDQEEVEFIAQSGLTLVYCPRTHELFGHGPHPFRRLVELGGRVALGTDGRSSNPDLDLWSEAKFVRQRHLDLDCATILDFVTRNGAAALGIADRFGVLAAGRRADFLVIRTETIGSGQPPELFTPNSQIVNVIRSPAIGG